MKQLLLLFCILQPFFSIAQTNLPCTPIKNLDVWTWPENNTEEAKEKWVLCTDFIEFKKYKIAQKPLEWLLVNAPCLNLSLYIKGEKVYLARIKDTEDDAEKIALQNKLIQLYYQRIKYFGDEKYVLERLGAKLCAYKSKEAALAKDTATRNAIWRETHTTYDTILTKCQNDTKHYNIKYFWISARRTFTDTNILKEKQAKAIQIIDYNLSKSSSLKAKWQEVQSYVTKPQDK